MAVPRRPRGPLDDPVARLGAGGSGGNYRRFVARTLRRRACQLVEASTDPRGGWHTNACHPVQHVASNLCFDLLTGQSPGEESPPNDGFVPIHRSLNEALSVVARTTLPADATMLFDGGNMLIALRRPTRPRDRCGPRWNDDVSLRMSIRHSVVDSLTIICAVGYHRRDPRCDLIKKTHYFGYVADIVLRQFNGDDFMRFGIDAEMQFAPTPRGTNTTLLNQPLALAIDLQTRCLSMRGWSDSSRPIDLGRMVNPPPRRLNVVWSGIAISMSSRAAIDRSSPSV